MAFQLWQPFKEGLKISINNFTITPPTHSCNLFWYAK